MSNHQYWQQVSLLAFIFILISLVGVVVLATPTTHTTDAQVVSPTPTATLFPPIASEEDWRAIIRPTDLCELPCWWDIRPGVTALDDIETILLSQFENARIRRWSGQRQLTVSQFDTILESDPNSSPRAVIGISLYSNDDIVNLIYLILGGKISSEVGYRSAWDYFSVTNVLEIYGIPDEIWLYAEQRSDGVFAADNLWLYWEEIGFSIRYYLFLDVWETGIQVPGIGVCFTIENILSVEISLFDQQGDTSIFQEITQDENRYLRELSDISEVSYEEFVDILVNGEEPGCLPADFPVNWRPTYGEDSE